MGRFAAPKAKPRALLKAAVLPSAVVKFVAGRVVDTVYCTLMLFTIRCRPDGAEVTEVIATAATLTLSTDAVALMKAF